MKNKRKILLILPFLAIAGFLFCTEDNIKNWDFEKIASYVKKDLIKAVTNNFPIDLDESKDIDIEEVVLNFQEPRIHHTSNLLGYINLVSTKFLTDQYCILDKYSSISSPPPEA